MVSTSELIDFWREAQGRNIHPRDEPFLTDPRGLDLTLLPQPWAGRLSTADIFVLHLNPGLDGAERKYEEENHAFRASLIANLSGASDYLFLDPRFTNHPGQYWARRILGQDIAFEDSQRICFVQAVPYHSKTKDDAYRVARNLVSTRMIQRWVQSSLLEAAASGEVSVIVTRAVRLYGFAGIPETPNLVIYRPGESRGGFVTKKTRGGTLLRKSLSGVRQ